MTIRLKTLILGSFITAGMFMPTTSAAQTGTSDAAAEIAIPSTVTRLSDLQFGDIVTGSSASTVIVEPFLESRTVATGDAVAFGGTVSAAEFEVNARPLLFYQITLPANAIITRSGGSETMVVSNFLLDGASIRLLPLFTPVGRFKVGGQLNVGPNQAAGNYQGSFAVNVNYF